jgi:GLPGLI family protein
MRKKYLLAILILACNCINAQKSKTCFIQYENYANNSWLYNCYFLKDTMMFTFEKVYKKMYQSFPVYDNLGNSSTETDTIKFKKEYYEHLDFLINHDKKSERVVTNKRAYNSNILTRYQEEKNNKQKLCIVDTLISMDNWEILDDTTTLLTYKCQKAKINYNNLQYEAWFTTQLPFNAGPKEFRGLPGLILKVSTKNEEKGFIAKEIVYPYKGDLPKYGFNGEVWSQKKYTAYVEELNKNSHQALEKLIENTIKGYKKEF